MLKLIKYEYRKDMIAYIIVFGLLLVLGAYLTISILAESETNLAISIILFILCGFAGVLFLMIMGVVSFARELSSKYSYMTFMTPNSSYRIVGSKYLTVFFTTLVATVIYGLIIYGDAALILRENGDVEDFLEILDQILSFGNKSVAGIVISVVIEIILVWIQILTTVSMAYLAFTLSATILSNSKGKVWLAIGFFVGIRVIVSVITGFLPHFDFGERLIQVILGYWPTILFNVVLIIGTYFGVSAMLDKKVSL